MAAPIISDTPYIPSIVISLFVIDEDSYGGIFDNI